MGGDLAPPTMVATQVRDERRQEKEEREKQPFDFYRRPSFVGGLNQTPSSFSGRKTAEAALALPLILISRACTRSRLHCLNGEWKHAKPAKRERESTETFFFFFFFIFSRKRCHLFLSLDLNRSSKKKKKLFFTGGAPLGARRPRLPRLLRPPPRPAQRVPPQEPLHAVVVRGAEARLRKVRVL